MSGKSQLVGVAGLGLVFANFWFTDERPKVSAGLFNRSATSADTTAAHAQLKTITIELLFVGGMTLIAGISDSLGSAMLAVIVALTILWLMLHYAGGSTKSSAGSDWNTPWGQSSSGSNAPGASW